MLEPEKVVRDEDGFWAHSQLTALFNRGNDPHREAIPKPEMDEWLAEHNIELHFVEMEQDLDENDPAWIRHFEEGNPGSVGWNPQPPGPEWHLLSIHDTEDGPMAMWYRERPSASTGDEGDHPEFDYSHPTYLDIMGKLSEATRRLLSAAGHDVNEISPVDDAIEASIFKNIDMVALELEAQASPGAGWVTGKNVEPPYGGNWLAYRPDAPREAQVVTLWFDPKHNGWSGQHEVTAYMKRPEPPEQGAGHEH